MINDPARNEPPLTEETDGEVERLLCDAYEAPALPASLLQRVDRLITQEWGQSPGLVAPRECVGASDLRGNPVVQIRAGCRCAVLVIGRGDDVRKRITRVCVVVDGSGA